MALTPSGPGTPNLPGTLSGSSSQKLQQAAGSVTPAQAPTGATQLTGPPSTPGVSGIQQPSPGTPTPPGAQYATDTAGRTLIDVNGVKIALDSRVAPGGTVTVKGVGVQSAGTPSESSSGGVKQGSGSKTTSGTAVMTVEQAIKVASSWSKAQSSQFVQDATSAGLIKTANPSNAEIMQAWALVVQESYIQGKSPSDLQSSAASGGWNSINPTIQPADVGLTGTGSKGNGTGTGGSTASTVANSTTASTAANTSQTSYISYLDPATVQQAQLQVWQKLLGRSPTQEEYQANLQALYGYENKANSGTFESGVVLKSGQKIDSKTGVVTDAQGKIVPTADVVRIGDTTTTDNSATASTDTTTQKNIVKQRGITTSGAGFIAQQAAMSNPEYGQYQAATTYFNAMIKALAGPASGMTASGP